MLCCYVRSEHHLDHPDSASKQEIRNRNFDTLETKYKSVFRLNSR